MIFDRCLIDFSTLTKETHHVPFLHTLRRCAAAAGLALASLVAQAQANPELPGQGVKVLPLKSSIAEEPSKPCW